MTNLETIKATIAPTLELLITVLSPAKIYWLPAVDLKIQEISGDINLLVILPDGKMELSQAKDLLEIVLSNQTHIWCAVVGQGAVIDGIKKGEVFYANACLPAHLLFDDGKKVYPTPDLFTLAQAKLRAMTLFLAAHHKAEAFYRLTSADASHHPPTTTTAEVSIRPFLLHQSIELCMRGALQALNGHSEKTHELRILARHLRRCAPELAKIFNEEEPLLQKRVAQLDLAYAKSRYEANFLMSTDALDFLTKKAEELLDSSKKSVLARLMMDQVPIPEKKLPFPLMKLPFRHP